MALEFKNFVTGLTEETTPDNAADFLVMYDTSGEDVNKVKPSSILGRVLSAIGGGVAVASAAALPVPTGNVFHVTGTTNITSITSTNVGAGTVVTLIFDDVLTFTDGNNLKLAGNFVTSADDTITLAYDGSNWFEIARSVN
jgi:hypothetical protein